MPEPLGVWLLFWQDEQPAQALILFGYMTCRPRGCPLSAWFIHEGCCVILLLSLYFER